MFNLTDLRKDYLMSTIEPSSFHSNPIIQFNEWFKQALDAKIEEPNAMILATVGKSGMPSSRVVLLKQTEEDGFVFFTNY